jgi:dopamine beta-monooxygenase
LPLNVFGQALKDNDYKWDMEFCSEDSDGDGFTNGEELGDPCCMWMANGIPSDYTANFAPTHPGVKASTPGKSYEPPSCDASDHGMALETAVLNEFNEGEEERSSEFYVDDYEIPAKKTTYSWFVFNFDDDYADMYHAVYAEAIVATPGYLHHYIIRGCSEKFPEEMHGKFVGDGLTSPEASCTQTLGGWAPGRDIISTPPWAGVPLGKDAGMVAFAVQVHYDNPNENAGVISRDGFRVHYTPTLREIELTGLDIMKTSLAPDIIIPAGRERYFMTRTCTLDVTDRDTGEPAEGNVFGVGFHAHLLGTEMYSRLFRGDEEEDLGSSRTWHFDDQGKKNLLNKNIVLKTGDVIQGTCIFDSRSRDTDTAINLGTSDEMCWQTFSLWPGTVQARCSSEDPLWLGELRRGESVDHIALNHPHTEAAAYWKDARGGACTSSVFGCSKTKLIDADYHPPLEAGPMSESGLACEVEPDLSTTSAALEQTVGGAHRITITVAIVLSIVLSISTLPL